MQRVHDFLTARASMRPWLNTTEDDARHWSCPARCQRFNEAVAQHHGGQHRRNVTHPFIVSASMRPWLNTTEDLCRHLRRYGYDFASMRPWLNTTEDNTLPRQRL